MAAGGACLALVLALLFGAAGSQTFYPREGAVGMWAAIGLMLRATVERRRAIRLAQAEYRKAAATEAKPQPADAGTGTTRAGGTPSSHRRRISIDALLWMRTR